MTAPLCFIDTETTGVHPGRKVWEIAMIRRDDSGQRETSFFVDVEVEEADPFGLQIGGFWERHPRARFWAGADRVDPECQFDHRPDHDYSGELVWPSIAAVLVSQWTHGAHLVGAVPDFDARTLDPLLRFEHLIPTWHYHLIDVEAMAVGWLEGLRLFGVGENGFNAEPVRPPWCSDDLSRACNVEPPSDDERHTALGDARWAMRWYDAMTGDDA